MNKERLDFWQKGFIKYSLKSTLGLHASFTEATTAFPIAFRPNGVFQLCFLERSILSKPKI